MQFNCILASSQKTNSKSVKEVTDQHPKYEQMFIVSWKICL